MKLKTEAKKADNITKAEYEVMKVLWERGEVSAGQLYRILQDKIGWKKAQPIRCWVNVLKKALWDVQNRIISAAP